MNDDVKQNRQPFQFTMRAFLVAAVGLAAVLPATTAEDSSVRFLAAGAIGLATVVAGAVGAVYGRGYFRTFCIGALVGALAPDTLSSFSVAVRGILPTAVREDLAEFIFVFWDLTLCALCGLFAMLVRWSLGSRLAREPAVKVVGKAE